MRSSERCTWSRPTAGVENGCCGCSTSRTSSSSPSPRRGASSPGAPRRRWASARDVGRWVSPLHMTELVLGPAVRYVSDTEATVWLETDGPCEATILDHHAPTFCVEDHHYALVEIHGLEAGRAHPYEVHLDGERVWPPPDDPFPPCAIRTLPSEGPLRVAFGSCRVSVPHEPPYTLPKDEDPRG